MDILHFFSDNPNVFLVVVAMISLLIGSFLNVVIYRLPRMIQHEWNQECRLYLGLQPDTADSKKLNLCLPFSHCTQCKKRLKPWHNIPILSYVILRGKCGFCYSKISLRYPIVELLTCITSVYVAWRFGLHWETLIALVFTDILICLTFIDLEYHLLPDQLTLLLVWTGLFFSLFGFFVTSPDAILGAILGYIIFAVVQTLFQWATGKIGMGQGDLKFLAGLGAYLGWQQLPTIIFLASIIGILYGIIHMMMKRQLKSTPIPFGPYLAIAGWISLIWGNEILHLYAHSVLLN